MADFDKAHAIVARNEGFYANNPNDLGGETYAGISRKNWPNWSGWLRIDSIKQQFGTSAKIINLHSGVDQVLQTQIKEFYKTNFWYPLNLQYVKDQQLANNIYDFAVNSGVGNAAKKLQAAVGVTIDGQVGNKTVQAINALDGKEVYDKFNVQRKAFYKSIADANPSQRQFLNSWLSRIKPYQV